MGYTKSSSKRKVYSNTILLQETRQICNKQLNFANKIPKEKSYKKERKQKNQRKNRRQREKEENNKEQCN